MHGQATEGGRIDRPVGGVTGALALAPCSQVHVERVERRKRACVRDCRFHASRTVVPRDAEHPVHVMSNGPERSDAVVPSE